MANMDRTQIANLVRNARAGDSAAMEQLLQTAYKNVLFQCQRILKHPEDAEDLTQEVLLIIYEKLENLQEPEHFISWANAIATRLCLNARARNPKDLQFTEDEEGHSLLDTLEELDRQAIPDAALDNAETQRMVRELVDALPELQRVTILAYYNAEMSIKEIAQEMGVSENTVKSRLVYGRRAIEKGVKDYEKQGIKLYTLSPLPFLLYFLRSAAEAGTGDTAASAAAAAVLSAGGAAAGTAASGTAGAAASGTAASGTAGAAAGGTAVSGAAPGAGILGGLGVKVAALVLAGAVAVGGATVLLGDRQSEPPAEEPNQSFQMSQPPEDTADPEAPVPLASYATRRTTVAEEAEFGFRGIYLETPQFEEVNEGYRKINAYLDQLHQAFNREDNPRVAGMLELYESDAKYAEYAHLIQVTYQDGYYLCLSSYESVWAEELNLPLMGRDPTDPHFQALRQLFVKPDRTEYTFDVRTGELLDLSDLYPGTDEEVAEWVAEAIRSSRFGKYLNEDNYPTANDGFHLAAWNRTMEEINEMAEVASSYDGGPYQRGQALYTWQLPSVDAMTIPLPAYLELAPEDG